MVGRLPHRTAVLQYTYSFLGNEQRERSDRQRHQFQFEVLLRQAERHVRYLLTQWRYDDTQSKCCKRYLRSEVVRSASGGRIAERLHLTSNRRRQSVAWQRAK